MCKVLLFYYLPSSDKILSSLYEFNRKTNLLKLLQLFATNYIYKVDGIAKYDGNHGQSLVKIANCGEYCLYDEFLLWL